MGIARTVSVLSSLLSLLPAQQQEQLEVRAALPEANMQVESFALQGLERFDAGVPEGAQTASKRLRSLLTRWIAATGKRRVLQLAATGPDNILVVRSTQAEIDALKAICKQLHKEEPLQVRLECSLVTMPWSVAQAQKLQDGRVVAVDDETVGKLMREASKNKGTLCNLPEVAAGPLTPFYVESPRKPEPKDAPTLRLRGEMLPLDDREVAVAMHLVRGALPVDKTREPVGALMQPVFRLQAGNRALATVVEGETATVLVVRCVDVAAKAPPAPVGR